MDGGGPEVNACGVVCVCVKERERERVGVGWMIGVE